MTYWCFSKTIKYLDTCNPSAIKCALISTVPFLYIFLTPIRTSPNCYIIRRKEQVTRRWFLHGLLPSNWLKCLDIGIFWNIVFKSISNTARILFVVCLHYYRLHSALRSCYLILYSGFDFSKTDEWLKHLKCKML